MFQYKKLSIFLILHICLFKQIHGQTTTTGPSTTTGPYQLPGSSYSACGPYSFGIIMAIMFISLIIVHTLIVGAIIKRLLKPKKRLGF
jgi:hypothetical protein